MSQDTKPAKIDPELLSACIHCGLCLSSCPTYLASSREMESPRGRIYLLNLLEKGQLPISNELLGHLDSCLGCLGCQTACPSGVEYGKLLDQARPMLAKARPPQIRRLMRFAFKNILPDYRRLNFLARSLALWQKLKFDKVTAKLGLISPLLNRFAEWQQFLPRVRAVKPLAKQSWISGNKVGEVQVFSGCVMDVFYNHVNHACVRLLANQRNIVRVPEQTCCGALAFHAGEADIASDLARRNIEYFEKSQGKIVATAAGCGAMLKEYGHLLKDDPEYEARAREFSERVVDITESLAEGQFSTKPNTLNVSVAYHAACHLAHAQGVRQAPDQLLNDVPGLKLTPLIESEHCCGSAGIYNLMHTDMSLEVLARKMDNIERTGAQLLVTTNPGCMLQIEKGIKDRGLKMKVCHLVELLDKAYSNDELPGEQSDGPH